MLSQSSFRIQVKREVAPDTWYYEVEAPLVARARKAGQFMIITPTPRSERIPISLAGGDPVRGTIHFAVQRVGRTTHELCALEEGECFFSILGPLGEPTHVQKYDGTVLCVGGGYGAGAVVPIAGACRELGNKVIGIVGARDAIRLIFVDEMRAAANETLLATENGSIGFHGRVTGVIEELLAKGEKIAHVYAIGPVPMMRAIAEQTRPLGIGCSVSLNAIMVDGTGMCGGCRVSVGGKSRFACFDGPDFDGHAVDFDMLVNRQRMYLDQEKKSYEYLKTQDNGGAADVSGDDDPACKMEQLVREYHARFRPLLPEGFEMPGNGNITPKQRMAIPRQKMPEQDPAARTHNFLEVALGLTPEQAIVEAKRCLQCRKPLCLDGCPVNIDIPQFLELTAKGDFLGAAAAIKASNCLPAITGRVCPQEKQCEAVCVLGKKGDAVSIGRLERFVADYERAHAAEATRIERPAPTGRKVAVVGSGPAGLTVAGELARRGHDVTIFEALHKPGGVLIYGIPEFRLPNSIVEQEIENLKAMGVKVICGALVGRSLTLSEMFKDEKFDAIFLGTGAGLPKMMRIPGEDLKGSYTANEYLTRINLMRADQFPTAPTPVLVGRHVVVIGGGNTAMDCVRTSRRMGCEHVTLLYRRTELEMPARREEVIHAQEEGVHFEFLAAPVALYGDEQGWVKEMECIRMELGEPDESGRRRPVEVKGSNYRIPAETVVSALGFGVNPLLASTTPELKVDKWGIIQVDDSRQTSMPRVYAGGDAITGGATVILAMGQGKRAAEVMARIPDEPAARATGLGPIGDAGSFYNNGRVWQPGARRGHFFGG
ncbi:MAG: NADPH-dependent glutamate synthase [bacterium]|nr:NADPH-dependent glutamate synthase [bacterium]